MQNLTKKWSEEMKSIKQLRGTTVDVDLTATETKNWVKAAFDGGVITLTNTGSDRGRVHTTQSFGAPIKIELRIKLSDPIFQVLLHRGSLKFSQKDGVNELTIINVVNKDETIYEGLGDIPVGEFVDVEWIIADEYTAVYVNGSLRYFAKETLMEEFSSLVSICCYRDMVVEVESLKITQ